MSSVEKNMVETLESVSVTLSPEQAEKLVALLGHCTPGSGFSDVFNDLRSAGFGHESNFIVRNTGHSVSLEHKPVW